MFKNSWKLSEFCKYLTGTHYVNERIVSERDTSK